MEIIMNQLTGEEVVFIINEDGTTWSALKSTYNELQAKADQPIGGNK
jgi:hypothetical protein